MKNIAPYETAAFGLLIRDVSRLVRRRFEEKLNQKEEKTHLTEAQWSVLYFLSKQEGVSQAELARMVDIEPITLVGLLDKLSSAGIVERRIDPSDRRIRRLYLTAAAKPLINEMELLRIEMRQEAFRDIPKAHQEYIMMILQQIRSNLVSAK